MTISKKTVETIHKIGKELQETKDEEKALRDITKVILDKKPSERSQSVSYSVVKKMMKEYSANQDFLRKIKPSDEITKRLIKKNAEIRDNKKILAVSKETIKKIIAMKTSTDPHELAMYLLFVSGRRSSEILDCDFRLAKDKKHIATTKLKKARNGDNNNEEATFSTITRPTTFLKIATRFKGMNVNKVTFPRMMGMKIKQMIDPTYHPHMLRGIYAAYMFKFNNPEKLKINSFIKQALNHKSIEPSLSYTGYSLTFEDKIKGI